MPCPNVFACTYIAHARWFTKWVNVRSHTHTHKNIYLGIILLIILQILKALWNDEVGKQKKNCTNFSSHASLLDWSYDWIYCTCWPQYYSWTELKTEFNRASSFTWFAILMSDMTQWTKKGKIGAAILNSFRGCKITFNSTEKSKLHFFCLTLVHLRTIWNDKKYDWF